MEFKTTVCEAFRLLRNHRGISQECVVHDTGYNIGNIENGRSCPSLPVFVKLCKYYKVESGRLLNLIILSLNARIRIKILIEEELMKEKSAS